MSMLSIQAIENAVWDNDFMALLGLIQEQRVFAEKEVPHLALLIDLLFKKEISVEMLYRKGRKPNAYCEAGKEATLFIKFSWCVEQELLHGPVKGPNPLRTWHEPPLHNEQVSVKKMWKYGERETVWELSQTVFTLLVCGERVEWDWYGKIPCPQQTSVEETIAITTEEEKEVSYDDIPF